MQSLDGAAAVVGFGGGAGWSRRWAWARPGAEAEGAGPPGAEVTGCAGLVEVVGWAGFEPVRAAAGR